jgi:hypothetical protein
MTVPVTLVAVSCAAAHPARARRTATKTANLGLCLLKTLYISKCPTLRTRSRAAVDVAIILARGLIIPETVVRDLLIRDTGVQ